MKAYNTNHMFLAKTAKTHIQMLRFAATGGIGTLVDYLLLYSLTEYLHVYYLFSAVISFFVCMVINYFLSIRWVFNKRKYGTGVKEFGLFILTGIGGLLLNEVLIWAFTEKLGMYYLWSKTMALVFLFLYSFFVRKVLLFR